MKINILLPYKEKFDENKASSVSITVKNNLKHSKFLNDIRIFGQDTDNPLFKKNFKGIKYSLFSLKSKNRYLADQMCNLVLDSDDKEQIIEIHNRPYLVEQVKKKISNFPVCLFLHNDPKTMRGTKSILERQKILTQCSTIFCVSNYVKAQFLDGIITDREKVVVLYNGVERKFEKFPTKKKEILYVGRLVAEKGVDLYVEVIRSIAKIFPDWTFNLIGSYKLGENKNINSYAYNISKKFKDIGSQTCFYGFKDHDFVLEKMKNTSIIVIPSLWEEPFGLVASESMSAGIAIIASKIGGIPEIIGNNGILIESINYLKLRKALIELINNKEKREYFQKLAWDNFKLI